MAGMPQKYNGEFSDSVAEDFMQRVKEPEKVARFTIEVDGDFADGVPIALATRYMNKMTNGVTDDYELEDLIMHYAVKGKMIKVLLDGTQVAAFVMNSLTDSWDSQPVFEQYPLAFNVLKEATTWSVIKKLLPPLKKESQAQAAAVK